MKLKRFDALMRERLEPVLAPHGFRCEKSKRCTFHRELPDGMFHVIMPDPSRDGRDFDVLVFPAHPAIDPSFDESFPDDLGVMTELCCRLNRAEGVARQSDRRFMAGDEERLSRTIDETVAPLLEQSAVPFLGGYRTLEDLLDLLPPFWPRALALASIGRRDEAQNLLEQIRPRMESLCRAAVTAPSIVRLRDRLHAEFPGFLDG